jgi:arginine/ornithine N-succinyltransferase beta subunit
VILRLLRLLQRWRRSPPPPRRENVTVETAPSAAIPDEHDEKVRALRARLRTAQDRLTVAQAEVQSMRVDAGAIQRDYTPPRRASVDDGQQA